MKSIVVANWKMHPASAKAARALFEATKKAAAGAKNLSVIVAPPALYLHELATNYRGKLVFGVQNAHWDIAAAHTGEISLAQAKDAGAKAVIIGHAERRALGESNEDTRHKVASALKLSMTPILCVGDKQRTLSGEHFTFVAEQLRAGLIDVPPSALPKILIAYEPVWAIGASEPMQPPQMHEMAIFIRKTIVELHGEKGHSAKILYGGSIDAENAPAMLRGGDVAGLLVGRASTDAHEFATLLKTIQAL